MDWGTFRREILSRLHDPALSTQVAGWYNDVQAEMLGRCQWRSLEKRLVTPTTAPFSSGTATFTNGSPTVTTDGTVVAAAAATQILRYSDGTYYDISAVDTTGTVLTLGSNFIGTTNTAGTYTIYFYALPMPSDLEPPRVLHVTVQTGAGPHYKLRYVTEDQLFDLSPNEVWTSTRPWRFRFFGNTIQMWPPPNVAYNLSVYYQRLPTEMATSTANETALSDWPRTLLYVLQLGVWARGLQFEDDSLWTQIRGEFEKRLTEEVNKNNKAPTTELTMRRWDEGGARAAIPLSYPRNL